MHSTAEHARVLLSMLLLGSSSCPVESMRARSTRRFRSSGVKRGAADAFESSQSGKEGVCGYARWNFGTTASLGPLKTQDSRISRRRAHQRSAVA